MRNKYILCLGELHAVFAHIRAIGNLINSSGIEDAWLEAVWNDNECVIRQILDCKHMKRAIEAHEATYIAINVILLRSIVKKYPQEFAEISSNLFTFTEISRKDILDNTSNLEDDINSLITELSKIEFSQKWSQFDASKQSNFVYRFMMVYIKMAKMVLTFIEASRSKDWLLHLSAAENLMQDFMSMNRIKYRRMFAAYIADMRYLQTSDPEIWMHFSAGEFSVQKTQIPFTAIGRDHAGEQVNRELKTRGGITGITHNDNSRTRQILIAPVLADIWNQMMDQGNASTSAYSKHHQFTKAYTERQNKKVLSFLEVMDVHNVNFDSDECLIRNLVTGQIFPENVCNDVIDCEATGKRLYDEFIRERLQTDSAVGYRSSAIMSYLLSQEVRWNIIRWWGRQLVKVLKNESGCSTQSLIDDYDRIAIDAMCLLNQMSKPTWVKTGEDLASLFCKRVNDLAMGATTYIRTENYHLRMQQGQNGKQRKCLVNIT